MSLFKSKNEIFPNWKNANRDLTKLLKSFRTHVSISLYHEKPRIDVLFIPVSKIINTVPTIEDTKLFGIIYDVFMNDILEVLNIKPLIIKYYYTEIDITSLEDMTNEINIIIKRFEDFSNLKLIKIFEVYLGMRDITYIPENFIDTFKHIYMYDKKED